VDGADTPSPDPTERVTRESGELACYRGCSESVQTASGTPEQKRLYCSKNCACLVSFLFDAQGKPRTRNDSLEVLVAGCKEKTVAELKWSPNASL
jgi:hypothetical protein